jgi:hypothetical protein
VLYPGRIIGNGKQRAYRKKSGAVFLYVKKALLLVDSQLDLTGYRMPVRKAGFSCKLQWTGKAAEFVELVYALHEAGSFNKGKVSLKETFETLGRLFNFEVARFSLYFMDIKNRKGERTNFLNRLKRILTERMEKADRQK